MTPQAPTPPPKGVSTSYVQDVEASLFVATENARELLRELKAVAEERDALKARVAELEATGLDVARVQEWQHTPDRCLPSQAFTAGPERMVADLIADEELRHRNRKPESEPTREIDPKTGEVVSEYVPEPEDTTPLPEWLAKGVRVRVGNHKHWCFGLCSPVGASNSQCALVDDDDVPGYSQRTNTEVIPNPNNDPELAARLKGE